jgi:hypothetical protein
LRRTDCSERVYRTGVDTAGFSNEDHDRRCEDKEH